MRKLITACALTALTVSPAAQAKKKPAAAWQLLRATSL